MLIYISGPYSEYTDHRTSIAHTRDENIAQARAIAIELWRLGHAVILPHGNTSLFDDDAPDISYETWIQGDLMMLARCDAIVMTPDWERSKGAKIEYEYAQQLGIPTSVYPNLPPLHPTEVRCPVQANAFAEILGQMYRTHLKKNGDYSSANIKVPGEIGVVVRIWDKVARMLNLTGFQFDTTVGEFVGPKAAFNEPLDDAYMDLSVYAIIGLLLRRKQWGC